MVDTEILEQMGLNKREAETYIALVELGSSLASTVANKTKINRSVTYEILEELIRKGFVSYVIRENRKYFSATDPTKLIDLLKERERRLKEVIPQLLELQKIVLKPGKERVEIYKGKEGLKTILEDILKTKEDFLNLGYTGVPSKILKHWYFHWDNKRVKLGIKRIALANPAAKGVIKKLSLVKVRYLPEDMSMPLSTVILKNKVYLILALTEPVIILIDNKDIAKAYNNYFWFMWKLCKP